MASVGYSVDNQWSRERDPTESQHGWQKVDTILWPRLTQTEQAHVRSQGGPRVRFTDGIANPRGLLDGPFRVSLLRRLRLPLPLSVRRGSCGRVLEFFGHHRAACSTVAREGRGFGPPGICCGRTQSFRKVRRGKFMQCVTLRGDDVQGFGTKWDEVLISKTEIPQDSVLESMQKMR